MMHGTMNLKLIRPEARGPLKSEAWGGRPAYNNILLTAIGLSPGGSGHLTHIQNMRQVCY
jgi:hypothetical protein